MQLRLSFSISFKFTSSARREIYHHMLLKTTHMILRRVYQKTTCWGREMPTQINLWRYTFMTIVVQRLNNNCRQEFRGSDRVFDPVAAGSYMATTHFQFLPHSSPVFPDRLISLNCCQNLYTVSMLRSAQQDQFVYVPY